MYHPGDIRALTGIQLCGASLSFIASSTIVVMIRKTLVTARRSGGNSLTPYRRLILGLSASDMLQSSALFLGPFIPPSDTPQSQWAIGSVRSCDAGGFFLLAGSIAVPLYTLALCIYYFCKIKYRRTMTNVFFYRRIEKKIHCFILLFASSLCIAALATKSMNTVPTGSFCNPASVPAGCREYPELVGECERGENAELFVGIFGFNTVVCLFGVVCFWGMICYHVIHRDRILAAGGQSEVPNQEGGALLSRTCNPCTFLCLLRNIFQQRKPDEPEAKYLSRLYLGQVLVQATLYISGYICTYGFIWIFTAYKEAGAEVPDWLYGCMTFFYSFGGVFNIFVYTRPNVRLLRMHKPEYRWLYAFWLVVKAGGEFPPSQEENAKTDQRAEMNTTTRNCRTCFSCCCDIFRVTSDGVSQMSIEKFESDDGLIREERDDGLVREEPSAAVIQPETDFESNKAFASLEISRNEEEDANSSDRISIGESEFELYQKMRIMFAAANHV